MHLYAKFIIIFMPLLAMSLSSCSSITGLENSNRHYRDNEAKITKSLEIPPNLFNPGKAKSHLAITLAQSQQDTLAEQDTYNYIPNFKAVGLAIKSNLSERWLEIDSINSKKIWSGVKRLLSSTGFKIKEERKDIGIITTEYQQRSELVPLDDIGPITKLLNSWRDELAEGVYDRYTVRVETDTKANKTRIYFAHGMLFSPDANEARGLAERWRIKPYSPIMEAQALYQAMVFFGSSRQKALAQLKISEYMVETLDGPEFNGLIFRAPRDKAWIYLQAMVYRTNWQMDKVIYAQHQMWIKVPEAIRKKGSILSGLAFWQETDKKDLPDLVRLNLEVSPTDLNKTILRVNATASDAPLNMQQRRYIFESLGLLAE